jgi:hypothetical protein
MLTGRCSCAISERPTSSLFALLSLFRPLSPTIPVHPRNAPVSPIIPVHTQKQGGGAYPSYDQSFHLGNALARTNPSALLFRGAFFFGGRSFSSDIKPRPQPGFTPPGGSRRHPFSRTMGNCCPKSRTPSYIYHYITYHCRAADIFAPRAARWAAGTMYRAPTGGKTGGMAGHETRATNHGSRVTKHGSRTTNHEPRTTSPQDWRKLSLSAILSCTHAVVRESPPNSGTCP